MTVPPGRQDPHPPRVPGYETGRLLGHGSSGEVWAGTDRRSGAAVALKVLRGDAGAGAQEGMLLGRVDHPHVVRLLDVVTAPEGVVLVLQRASGGSLAAQVGARGPLEPGEVVTVLAPVASALADLHARGLVHGDVSPGNVLFADDGRPLLADLGVSSLLGLPADAHGTPGYGDAAAGAGGPAPAGDVHALAAVAWFALTGQAPPPADLRPPLVAAAPETPPRLADLVEAGLDARPERRPDAASFAVAAFDAAPATPVRLVPVDPTAAAAEVVTHRLRAAAGAAPPARPRRRPRRRRRRVLAATAALLAVATAAVVVGLGQPWGAGGPRPGEVPAASAPVTGTASAAASEATPAPTTPTGTATATAEAGDPSAAVVPISRLRAEAFSTGDPQPLLAAAAAGSPALADDLRLLADLVSAGLVLEGLAFEVGAVDVLEHRAEEAQVRVEVTTGAHRRVRTADGVTVEEVPASAATVSQLVLRPTDGAWRVHEVVTGGPDRLP